MPQNKTQKIFWIFLLILLTSVIRVHSLQDISILPINTNLGGGEPSMGVLSSPLDKKVVDGINVSTSTFSDATNCLVWNMTNQKGIINGTIGTNHMCPFANKTITTNDILCFATYKTNYASTMNGVLGGGGSSGNRININMTTGRCKYAGGNTFSFQSVAGNFYEVVAVRTYNFSASPPPSSANLSITGTSPSTNTQYNTNPIVFQANITALMSKINCSLTLNAVKQSPTKVFSPASGFKKYNYSKTFTTSGEYNYSFSCYNTTTLYTANSTIKKIYWDATTPTIVTSYKNGTKFWGNFSAQFNVSDDFILHSVNISVNGVQKFGINTLTSKFFQANFSYGSSGVKFGNVTVRAADGHTAASIGNYEVSNSLFTDKLSFSDKGETISIAEKTDSILNIFEDKWNAEKQIDRYTFTYTPKTISSEYTFIVNTNENLYIVEKPESKYKMWIVTSLKWMDFVPRNEPDFKILIKKISNRQAEVTLSNLKHPEKIEFESIGDLNIATKTFTFSVGRPWNVTFILPPVNNTHVAAATYKFKVNATFNLTPKTFKFINITIINGTTRRIFQADKRNGTTSPIPLGNNSLNKINATVWMNTSWIQKNSSRVWIFIRDSTPPNNSTPLLLTCQVSSSCIFSRLNIIDNFMNYSSLSGSTQKLEINGINYTLTGETLVVGYNYKGVATFPLVGNYPVTRGFFSDNVGNQRTQKYTNLYVTVVNQIYQVTYQVIDQLNNPYSNYTVSLYNGSSTVPVDSRQTDQNGQTIFTYDPNSLYFVKVFDKNNTLVTRTPTAYIVSSPTIIRISNGQLVDIFSPTKDVTYKITPNILDPVPTKEQNFTLQMSSPLGYLDYFGINSSFNGIFNSNSSTTATGGTVKTKINTMGQEGKTVPILFYYSIQGKLYKKPLNYFISTTNSSTNYNLSVIQTFAKLKTDITGSSSGSLYLFLISLFGSLFIGLIFIRIAGVTGSAMVSYMAFVGFGFLGWLPPIPFLGSMGLPIIVGIMVWGSYFAFGGEF